MSAVLEASSTPVATATPAGSPPPVLDVAALDRKSTRLNSSHDQISYAVFCLKKKKTKNTIHTVRITTHTRRTLRQRASSSGLDRTTEPSVYRVRSCVDMMTAPESYMGCN